MRIINNSTTGLCNCYKKKNIRHLQAAKTVRYGIPRIPAAVASIIELKLYANYIYIYIYSTAPPSKSEGRPKTAE